MNCSHAPASRFRIVAGLNVSRVISSRLTTRGLGTSRFGVSGKVCSSGKLRPKRRPAAPIFGKCRSLCVPSIVAGSAKRRIEIGRNLLPRLRRLFRVVEVLLAQLVAHLEQPAIREQARQLVPGLLLEKVAELVKQIVVSH